MKQLSRKIVSGKSNGQYMVEFALLFVLFVPMFLMVVDTCVLAYNYNIAYKAANEGARLLAMGKTNVEIKNALWGQTGNEAGDKGVLQRFMPTTLLELKIDTGFLTIYPETEIYRVDGSSGRVVVNFTVGLSLLDIGVLAFTFPCESRMVINADNDKDRDGYIDALEIGQVAPDSSSMHLYPNDHNNDFNPATDDIGADRKSDTNEPGYNIVTNPDPMQDNWGTDTPANYEGNLTCDAGEPNSDNDPNEDSDGDGKTDSWDTAQVRYTIAGGFEFRLCLDDTGTLGGWQSFDGTYYAPEIWKPGFAAYPSYYKKYVPKIDGYGGGAVGVPLILDLRYDYDNDLVDDKFDTDWP